MRIAAPFSFQRQTPLAPKTRSWVAWCAIACAAFVAMLLWITWPTTSAGMTADEFRQMYEGDASGDTTATAVTFP